MTPEERAAYDAAMERLARLMREPVTPPEKAPDPPPVRHYGPNRATKREATRRNRR